MEKDKSIEKKMSIIKQMLEQNGLLTEADEINLQLLEEEFKVYSMCNADIEKYGTLIEDARGSLKTNPSCNLRNKSANTILNILKEFGISTKSRKLLLMKDIDVEQEESPLTAYMKTIR